MIDMTSRRERRDTDASDRLLRLIGQARADPPAETTELARDQQWVDVSAEPPDPDPPPREPWWRRGRAGRLVEHWAPGGADSRRGRVAAMALVGGLVLAVLIGVTVALSAGGTEQEAPPALPVASAAGAASRAATSIVVSVVGKVVEPGLVTLSDGARVADALKAAGGQVAGVDLSGLNLARRLADGEQIYVGVPVPAGAEPVGEVPGAPGVADKVDLNTASVTALDTLPGVGPVTAQRIVDWRTQHGRFGSVEQLREVDGIGPARFAKLKELVVAR